MNSTFEGKDWWWPLSEDVTDLVFTAGQLNHLISATRTAFVEAKNMQNPNVK